MRGYPKQLVCEFLQRRIPIFSWLPRYSWTKLLQDCLAGTTVGLTVIPQGIAYAIVAGLPPQYGLYSSFMGCFVYLIFGSCKDVTIGPTAIMGLLTQPFVLKYGADFAVLLCFLSGIIMTMMGLLNLGFLVDFISMPVICGFTNAAAIIIGSSQFSTILGIKGRSESFIDAIRKLFAHYREIKPWDALLGFISICLLILLKNLKGKRNGTKLEMIFWILCLARNAIIVVLGMLLAYVLTTEDVTPFNITGNITGGLPPIEFPPFSTEYNNRTLEFTEMVNILGGTAISVPLIAFLEQIAIAKSFAKGKKIDASQEMIALGLSNFFGSFVSSMPITGSFTRTAVNNASGVKTTFGGVITGVLVLMACGFLTKTFKFIPKATLAAVIIVAMYFTLEIRAFFLLWKTKKIDLLPFLVTLIVCLTAGLEYGIVVGILINLTIILYGAARPGLFIEDKKVNGCTILFVSPKQSLSFPAAEYLRDQVMKWCDTAKDLSLVIIDGRSVNSIDATVGKNLSILYKDLERRNQKLIFWNWDDVNKKVLLGFNKCPEYSFKNSALIAQIVTDEISQSTAANSMQVEVS